MKTICGLLLIGFLFACGNQKSIQHPITVPDTDNSVQPKIEPINANVSITISQFTPYCGGAAPSKEILAQQNQPERSTAFILLDLNSNEKTKVMTDTAGILQLELPEGKYAIRETYKDCSFEEFMSQTETLTGQNYEPTNDPDCYKNWWQENLGEFEITTESTIQKFEWQTGSSCFVGRNPCVFYTGPWPP